MATATTTELQSSLEELVLKHGVPGASVALLDNDEVTEAATGVINKNTGVETTTDSLFQIASITKVFTATLVMQLIDEGKIALDQPVRDYLPALKFADPEATDSITVRQLLSHSSGLDGELHLDTGRGDDCVRKYVEACATLPQISAPGTMFSYCNAGFVVLGRLIEVVTGQIWDQALKERLLKPLGTQRIVSLPEEAILHRVAIGHVDSSSSGELTTVPAPVLPRSTGPKGGIYSTAAELLVFARLHLNDGVAGDGTAVLSKESVHAMQRQQIESPDKWLVSGLDAWGLGWMLLDCGGHRVIGHDGGGIGQCSFLRIVPEARFAVSLLTNSLTGTRLSRDFFQWLFAKRVGIDLPDMPETDDEIEVDPSLYAGIYERMNQRTEVEVEGEGLVASIEWGEELRERAAPVTREPLRPVDKSCFLFHCPGFEVDMPFLFFDFDERGRPGYFHSLGRANLRVQ